MLRVPMKPSMLWQQYYCFGTFYCYGRSRKILQVKHKLVLKLTAAVILPLDP